MPCLPSLLATCTCPGREDVCRRRGLQGRHSGSKCAETATPLHEREIERESERERVKEGGGEGEAMVAVAGIRLSESGLSRCFQ